MLNQTGICMYWPVKQTERCSYCKYELVYHEGSTTTLVTCCLEKSWKTGTFKK